MGLHYWSHEEAEHDDSYVPEHFRVEAGPSPSQLKEVVTKVRRRGAGFCSTLNTLTKTCLELVVFNPSVFNGQFIKETPIGRYAPLGLHTQGAKPGVGARIRTLLPSETPALNKQHVHRPFFPNTKPTLKYLTGGPQFSRQEPSVH